MHAKQAVLRFNRCDATQRWPAVAPISGQTPPAEKAMLKQLADRTSR